MPSKVHKDLRVMLQDREPKRRAENVLENRVRRGEMYYLCRSLPSCEVSAVIRRCLAMQCLCTIAQRCVQACHVCMRRSERLKRGRVSKIKPERRVCEQCGEMWGRKRRNVNCRYPPSALCSMYCLLTTYMHVS